MKFSFEIKERIPTKKNQYEIRWNQRAYKVIKQVLQNFKGPLVWIAPNKRTQNMETLIAWAAKTAISEKLTGPLRIIIYAQSITDIDGPPQIILDAIEKSGRIDNDRQFKELVVRVNDERRHGCLIEIEPLSEVLDR
ncbi:hypothetical protein MYX75_00955 [Acidobacteria bacterium AH-259-A15]|nr:hypothetical protein [Acidobacteria bacterium AH-259-A15]